jgi:hypothetical protein
MSESRWSFDRTGFPYLEVPGEDYAVALFPVMKVQAEVWLGDPAGPGDDWYAGVLEVSPRIGWRTPGPVPLWHLMLTGVEPDEVGRFAGWLGRGYRLPTAAEWRAGDRALSAVAVDELARVAGHEDAHPAVSGLLRRLHSSKRRTAAELSLLDGGVLEWVMRPGLAPGGLGRPAADVPARVILDPQAFDPVTLLRPGRHPAFGARLVCPLVEGDT